MLNLIKNLKNGRYLLETKTKPFNCIYILILNDNFAYQTYKLEEDTNINLKCLFGKESKKLMYKITHEKSGTLKSIQNDYNVNSFIVSDEQFNFLSYHFKNSTKSLASSMRLGPNEFYFALV